MQHPPLVAPTPTPDAIRAARVAAGLTLAQAAEIVALGSHARWAEYEAGRRAPDPCRWAVFLLATGQHPTHRIAARRMPPKIA